MPGLAAKIFACIGLALSAMFVGWNDSESTKVAVIAFVFALFFVAVSVLLVVINT